MSSINERLKEVRKFLNYNQQEFASELGISRTHVSNMENGNDNPSSTLIKLICMRFNISEDWLNTGEGHYIPSFNSETHEGLISRYNTIRVGFEQRLKSLNEPDLLNNVEAFAYLDSILTADGLDGLEKTSYLMFLHESIDDLERIISRSRHFRDVFSQHSQERYLPQFKKELNAHIDMIAENIKSAANIYLSKHGESALL